MFHQVFNGVPFLLDNGLSIGVTNKVQLRTFRVVDGISQYYDLASGSFKWIEEIEDTGDAWAEATEESIIADQTLEIMDKTGITSSEIKKGLSKDDIRAKLEKEGIEPTKARVDYYHQRMSDAKRMGL